MMEFSTSDAALDVPKACRVVHTKFRFFLISFERLGSLNSFIAIKIMCSRLGGRYFPKKYSYLYVTYLFGNFQVTANHELVYLIPFTVFLPLREQPKEM